MIDNHLKIFLEVAESGSFTKASNKLKISPQAVLKQIQLLEGKIGVKLFNRSPTGLTLTGGGMSILKDTKYLISYVTEAQNRARQIESNKRNVIKAAISQFTPTSYLTSIWPLVIERYPTLRIQIVPFSNDEVATWELLTHMGDSVDIIASSFDDDFLERRGCQGMKLAELPVKVLMPVFHPLADRNELKISELEGQTVLINEKLWMRSYDIAKNLLLKNSKIKFQTFHFFDINLLNKCVNENSLILGLDIWRLPHPLMKSVPLDWNTRVPYGLIYAKRPSIPTSRFLEMIHPAIKRLGYNPFYFDTISSKTIV